MSTIKVNTLTTLNGSGNITVSRPLSGSGASLTALNATELTSGTVPDARFPATLPAASAANLTSIPAGNLTGTVADARISTLTASKLSGALPAISGASLTNLPGGITEVDIWRLHTGFTTSGSSVESFITTNLERNDTAFTKMGTGMTQSNGVFTFPSTGLWQVFSQWNCYKTSEVIYFNTEIQLSTDSGSSFTARAYASAGGFGSGNGGHSNIFNNAILNITNASTSRVRFRGYASAYSVTVQGNSNADRTSFTFIRLGDSQ